MKNLEILREQLKRRIEHEETFEVDRDSISWTFEIGVLLTINEAHAVFKALEDIEKRDPKYEINVSPSKELPRMC